MANAEVLRGMSDDQLINYMQGQISSPAMSMDQATTNRDIAKAILDSRSAKVMQQQNQVMIGLTKRIEGLTVVMAILTFVLVILTIKMVFPNVAIKRRT